MIVTNDGVYIYMSTLCLWYTVNDRHNRKYLSQQSFTNDMSMMCLFMMLSTHYNGKSHLEMDDLGVALFFRKPPLRPLMDINDKEHMY